MELRPHNLVPLVLVVIIYPVDALRYLLCQHSAPLRCGAGGVLYIQSVHCPAYGYAMQLLQENCSDRRSCSPSIDVTGRLREQCCGHHPGTPHIIYLCPGSSDLRGDAGTVAVDPGLRKTFGPGSGGHSMEDEVVVIVLATLFVFLWGCGVLFFYFRYNYTAQCKWLYRKRRPKTCSSQEPVYAYPDSVGGERYIEIHSYPSPVFANHPHPQPHPLPSAPYSCDQTHTHPAPYYSNLTPMTSPVSAPVT